MNISLRFSIIPPVKGNSGTVNKSGKYTNHSALTGDTVSFQKAAKLNHSLLRQLFLKNRTSKPVLKEHKALFDDGKSKSKQVGKFSSKKQNASKRINFDSGSDVDEYTDTYLYFKNLKTDEGSQIVNRYKNNVNKLMNVDPSSVKASYLQTIIELIQDGAINSRALNYIEDLSDFSLVGDDNWNFSPNLINDIEKMYGVIAQNKDKTNLEKELKDAFIPAFKDDKEGIGKVQTGEVYEIAGNRGLKIKTSEHSSKQLNLSKETYYRLFPPIERFVSSQRELGDCYCIEAFMNLYSNPEERANLLSVFSEDSSGNITVKLPKAKHEVVFENGRLADTRHPELYSSGADGYKMLEYAYGEMRLENAAQRMKEKLSGNKLEHFCKIYEDNPENIFFWEDTNGSLHYARIDKIIENPELTKRAEKIIGTAMLPTSNALLLRGGMGAMICNAMGYNDYTYYHFMPFNETVRRFYENNGININNVKFVDDELMHNLQKPELYDDNIVHLGIRGHEYSLTCEKDLSENKKFYLYNPTQQGIPIEISDIGTFLEENNFINNICVIKKLKV